MSCFNGENAATSEVLNNVVRKLPGVPESEAREYVNQALRDFAREADCWTFKDFELGVCAGDQVIEIPADTGIEVKAVDKVLVQEAPGGCGCSGDPSCWHELAEGDESLCLNRLTVCGSCGGQEWMHQAWQETNQQRGQIRFARPWQYPARLRFHLTLLPAEGSDTFPPHLLADNRRVIEAGALAFGYMIPGQEWSDAKAGLFYMQIWERGLGAAEEKKKERLLQARLDLRPGRPTYSGHDGYQRGRGGRFRGYRDGYDSRGHDASGATSCEPGCC